MEAPLVVPASSPSNFVIVITPSMRLTGHLNPTCIPPSTSDDERLDASEGHAQDKAASAAAVSDVVPAWSLVVVQSTMVTTPTGVGSMRACGVG